MTTLTESKIIAQITRDIASNSIMVRWDNIIQRGQEVISRIPQRCAYSVDQKDQLLADCPEAAGDVQAMGW